MVNNTLQKLEPTSELIASLEKLGVHVEEGASIVAVQNTPGVINFVIPKASEVKALGDHALDKVAGGGTHGYQLPPHIMSLAVQYGVAYELGDMEMVNQVENALHMGGYGVYHEDGGFGVEGF